MEIWGPREAYDASAERLVTCIVKIAVQLALTAAEIKGVNDGAQTRMMGSLVYGSTLVKMYGATICKDLR
ncbi:MAG: hypothetical protein ABIX01_11975 [Chitinophagaceae bacterium]